jgi:hypothetical protein
VVLGTGPDDATFREASARRASQAAAGAASPSAGTASPAGPDGGASPSGAQATAATAEVGDVPGAAGRRLQAAEPAARRRLEPPQMPSQLSDAIEAGRRVLNGLTDR